MRLLQLIRRGTRFIAAAVFWLHALAVIGVPALPLAHWLAQRIGVSETEAWIIIVIALLSILLSYGLSKFAVDAAYVYFFPFIFPYILATLGYRSLRSLYRIFGTPESQPATAQVMVVQPASTTNKQTTGAEQNRRTILSGFLHVLWELFRPFRQFVLLWCLLLLLTHNTALIWIALVVILLRLVFVLFKTVMLAILSMNWLSQLEEKIRSRVEDAISKILGVPEDADYPPDLKAVLGGLYGVRNAISLLRYRRRITQSIIALSLLAFLGMYLYLALLFSFAYFGIAKVELIPYTWAEALVTSIFIPFA